MAATRSRSAARVQRAPLDQSRPAFGHGAGLVERDGLQAACAFQINAALDQDAAPRGGGEAADDRHRCGDDQCAGAGDDQQHQGLVDGLQPRPAEQPGPRDRNQHRDDEHRRRVDRGEAVDEALRRRPVPLGLLDRVNDPRQRGVGRQRRHLDLEQTVLVDRAGEDRVARSLSTGMLSPVTGAWLMLELPATTTPSSGTRSPGRDAHDRAQRHLFNSLYQPLAVGLTDRRCLGRHRHQPGDGIARAFDRPGFDQFGDRVQRHHHRRFGPLADEYGTRHRHAHQRVDVQPARPAAPRCPSCKRRSRRARWRLLPAPVRVPSSAAYSAARKLTPSAAIARTRAPASLIAAARTPVAAGA